MDWPNEKKTNHKKSDREETHQKKKSRQPETGQNVKRTHTVVLRWTQRAVCSMHPYVTYSLLVRWCTLACKKKAKTLYSSFLSSDVYHSNVNQQRTHSVRLGSTTTAPRCCYCECVRASECLTVCRLKLYANGSSASNNEILKRRM